MSGRGGGRGAPPGGGQLARAAASLKHTLHAFRKNPEHLTEREQGRWDDLDLKHLANGQAYLARLELRDSYQRTVQPAKARYRLGSWLGWMRGNSERFGERCPPPTKSANTLEKHLEGILAHWTSGWLST